MFILGYLFTYTISSTFYNEPCGGNVGWAKEKTAIA